MSRLQRPAIFFALVTLITTLTTVAAPPKIKIVIDAGHGGTDTGATSGGKNEAEIALQVAQKLRDELLSSGSFEVHMTRNANLTISLDSRTKLADKLKADLFLSLHLNSNPSPSAHGTEIYIFGQLPEDEESMFLAHQENEALKNSANSREESEDPSVRMTDLQIILQDIQRTYGTKESLKIAKTLKTYWVKMIGTPTRINQAPFHVLANISSPSLLIELGFISHPLEGAWLAQAPNQEKMAKSLALGLKKFAEELDKAPAPVHISGHAN